MSTNPMGPVPEGGVRLYVGSLPGDVKPSELVSSRSTAESLRV